MRSILRPPARHPARPFPRLWCGLNRPVCGRLRCYGWGDAYTQPATQQAARRAPGLSSGSRRLPVVWPEVGRRVPRPAHRRRRSAGPPPAGVLALLPQADRRDSSRITRALRQLRGFTREHLHRRTTNNPGTGPASADLLRRAADADYGRASALAACPRRPAPPYSEGWIRNTRITRATTGRRGGFRGSDRWPTPWRPTWGFRPSCSSLLRSRCWPASPDDLPPPARAVILRGGTALGLRGRFGRAGPHAGGGGRSRRALRRGGDLLTCGRGPRPEGV